MPKLLVVIIGQTAIGKTDFSIDLAKVLGADIFSADSRQFYRELNIGTAKPTKQQLDAVKHHFINHKSIQEDYNVGDFEHDINQSLQRYFKTKHIAILTGGSGLYLDSVINGIDNIPKIPSEFKQNIRLKLENTPIDILLKELHQKDITYYQTIDKSNKRRIIRALEVIEYTQLPFSSFHKKAYNTKSFDTLIIGIQRQKDILHQRIQDRTQYMIEAGLCDEVKQLLPYKTTNALQTIGYKEIIEYLEEKISIDRAIELINRNTRRYTKRQMTWFRRYKNTVWFSFDEEKQECIKYISKYINTLKQ